MFPGVETTTSMFDGCLSAAGKGGYVVSLSESITGRLYCSLCHLLMRDPVQTCRGELACSSCYEHAKSETGRCPIDGEVIDTHEVFRDKGIGHEIGILSCYCSNKHDGCTWSGQVYQVEKHEERCKYRPIKCYLCGEDIGRLSVNTHMDSCDKWSSEGSCVYDGCYYKPKNSEDLKEHLKENTIFHAMLHSSAITNAEKDRKQEIELINRNNKNQELKVDNDMEMLKGQLTLLMRYTTDMQNKYDTMETNFNKKINQLEATISEINQLETSISELNIKDKSVNSTSSSSYKALTNDVDAMNKNIAELDLRQQLFENTSYDGKLIWKIDNVSQRMSKATNGTITALHSAPIFTSKYGYKFCGRLYLNGDGLGKETHISLFFVLMKSEYDNLLQWPFNKLITFRLINQKLGKEDVVERFVADANSSSFAKPSKDMNIASGCPYFVEKEKVLNGGYIKDDTLFIEISVC